MTTPDEEALAFEALVVASVTGAVVDTLDDLVTAVLAAYAATAATVGGILTGEQGRALGAALARHLRTQQPPAMNPALAEHAQQARLLGVTRELRRVPDLSRRITISQAPAVDLDASVRTGLEEAARIATVGIRTKADASAVAGKVKATRSATQGTARWVTHEGLNAGVAAVAKAADMRLLWVPERNACLHCLAHAGWVVEPGETFPAGLTFDPAGSRLRAVKWPPLHPGCRCEAQSTRSPAGRPDTDRSRVDPAARLAAEARRSVVYQWTDYASGPAMQRAAEALLRAGAHLPTTVEQRARRAIKRGGVRRP